MMGTIGDRFGDLAALLGAEGEAAPSDAGAGARDGRDEGAPTTNAGSVSGRAHGSVSGRASDSASGPVGSGSASGPVGSGSAPSPVGDQDSDGQGGSEPTLESTIAATIAELNRVEVSDLDFDHDFTALDLSGLPLWALVAEVERFLGRKFTDDEVGSWDTPRDILRAAERDG